jgi:glycosyltransferase involved in cell wall biosynthesis
MVTAHNVWSHERRHPRVETLLWNLLGLVATDLHLLSPAAADEFVSSHPTFGRASRHVIPHGNYEPVVEDPPDRETARRELGLPAGGRVLLTFGMLKSYKGAEDLLAAFDGLDDEAARLMVVGRVGDERLARRIEAVRARDPRVIAEPRFVSDRELARFIRASDCVVLPYRRVLNSGSALLALTLGRPVLLPRTPTFEDLRRRVGGPWVHLFDDLIATGDLARVQRRAPDRPPELAWCSWERVSDDLARLWA